MNILWLFVFGSVRYVREQFVFGFNITELGFEQGILSHKITEHCLVL